MNAQLLNSRRAADAATSVGDDREHRDNGFLGRILTWVEQGRRYRRTRDELAGLNDRELADIGLHRIEIETVARRCAQA